MHCFNEVALSDGKFLSKEREKMEDRCQQWSIYEYKLLQGMHLCRESEFPDKVLIEMLAEGSDSERIAILQALRGRSQLSGSVLGEIAALLKDNTDQKVKDSTAQALGKQPSLPDTILQALVSRLEHTEGEVRDSSLSDFIIRSPSLSGERFRSGHSNERR